MIEPRVACPACRALILEGAQKCRACKAWVVDPAPSPSRRRRLGRPLVIVGASAITTAVVLLLGRESKVEQAPPLTRLGADSAAAPGAPAPAGIGPEIEPEPDVKKNVDIERRFKVREIKVGEGHPRDVEWSASGQSLYVSADDGSLREIRVKTGEIVQKVSVPVEGDQLKLLFNRYIAVLRHEDATRVPVLDTTALSHDPIMLDVGMSPGDIVELPDGQSVIAATNDGKRVSRFELPSGARVADITLPHATGQLFLAKTEGRLSVAAIGALHYAGRPGGAWIDLFDPDESPFGASRRSISVGRDPGLGAVTSDGAALFFPDRVSNTATLLSVKGATESHVVPVGQSPEAAFLLAGDRYGVTINSAARTATVVELETMRVASTLMLDGEPHSGVTSPDRRRLFVTLGGSATPPVEGGVMVIGGEPPRVLGSYPTGKGAASVAVSKDGSRAAVACFWDKSITLLE